MSTKSWALKDFDAGCWANAQEPATMTVAMRSAARTRRIDLALRRSRARAGAERAGEVVQCHFERLARRGDVHAHVVLATGAVRPALVQVHLRHLHQVPLD